MSNNVKSQKLPDGYIARCQDNPKCYYFLGDDAKDLTVNYKEQIISLIDEMIEETSAFDSPRDMWDKGYDNGYKKALTELKEKIEKL